MPGTNCFSYSDDMLVVNRDLMRMPAGTCFSLSADMPPGTASQAPRDVPRRPVWPCFSYSDDSY